MSNILNAEQMKEMYGKFYNQSPRITINRNRIPANLLPLFDYAQFWGILDEVTRLRLVHQAPAEVQRNLKEVVTAFDAILDDWLVQPEETEETMSLEYVAYTALRMASDSV
jgi:hypothetical protein